MIFQAISLRIGAYDRMMGRMRRNEKKVSPNRIRTFHDYGRVKDCDRFFQAWGDELLLCTSTQGARMSS